MLELSMMMMNERSLGDGIHSYFEDEMHVMRWYSTLIDLVDVEDDTNTQTATTKKLIFRNAALTKGGKYFYIKLVEATATEKNR